MDNSTAFLALKLLKILMLPVVVFGVFYLIMRMARHPKTGITQYEYLEQILVEEKRHNAQLEKLLDNTIERLDLLEQGDSKADNIQ